MVGEEAFSLPHSFDSKNLLVCPGEEYGQGWPKLSIFSVKIREDVTLFTYDSTPRILSCIANRFAALHIFTYTITCQFNQFYH